VTSVYTYDIPIEYRL